MLYDVKRISFCPSRYWPTVAVASSRGGPLEHRASLVRAEYVAAAAALKARPDSSLTTHNPHVSATTEAAADSTAAGPEPTAPRGRLMRFRNRNIEDF